MDDAGVVLADDLHRRRSGLLPSISALRQQRHLRPILRQFTTDWQGEQLRARASAVVPALGSPRRSIINGCASISQALNRMLDAAGSHRRGPHHMPHTNVSWQLGHKGVAIATARLAHWLPHASKERLVDRARQLNDSSVSERS